MTRVIVSGSRKFNNTKIFTNAMSHLLADIPTDELEIISGGCRGADAMGEQYAKTNKINLKVFPANWKAYGRAAGPIRNEEMAKYASENNNGMLIAFPMGKSTGTRNMICFANQYGLDVHVIECNED